MKLAYWALRVLLVILLAGFFVKNADPVTLRLYLGYQWNVPVALIMLLFFVGGVIVGLLVPLRTVLRLRRELAGFRSAQRRGSETDATPGAGIADLTGRP